MLPPGTSTLTAIKPSGIYVLQARKVEEDEEEAARLISSHPAQTLVYYTILD